MKANDDVTDALRRTLNLMQGELERSVLATQTLGIYFFLALADKSPDVILFRYIDCNVKSYLCDSRYPHEPHGHIQTADHRLGKVGLA